MFGSTPFGSSAFGSNTSAFGNTSGSTFGSSGFGSGGSLFGAKTTATTGFGTVAPSQTGSSIFGNNTTGSTGLFGAGTNQAKSGFGGFGTNTSSGGLFGNTGSSGTGLFSGSTNAFGSANKSIFGGSTNNTGSLFGSSATTNSGTSLFGAKPQGTGSLFGLSNSNTGGLFGNTAAGGQNAAGTPTKFNAQKSTDTMVKSGVQTSISTRHQCITLMKEYDKKSLEELRMEDYQLGRKGPQASGTTAPGTGMFGNSTFGTSSGTTTFGSGGFGSNTGTGLFGQTQQSSNIFGAKTTASLFGNSTSTFGASSAFSNTSGGSLFGNKTGGLFGSTTTTQSTGVFGATPAFGGASSGGGLFGNSTFGQNTQASAFGSSSQSGGLFGKPAFGATNSSGTGLFGAANFGQTTQSSLFSAKPTGGAFGTANTGGLFGGPNKPTFGTTFGTGTAAANPFGTTTGSGLFGSSSLGFGNASSSLGQPSMLGGAFGQTTLGAAGTGTLGLGQNNLAALQQQQQLQQQLQQQVLALSSSPFGDSPLFRNLTSRTKPEKPLALPSQAKPRGSSAPSQYKVSPRPSARIKPRAIGKSNFSQARLFDGLDDEIEYTGETFVPRRSVKKLVLNSKSQTRSIAGELSEYTQSKVNGRDAVQETLNNTQTESSKKKFYSPKLNSSLSQDEQDSPVVGIRTSKHPNDKEFAENAKNATNGVENSSPNEEEEEIEEQGPEPRENGTSFEKTRLTKGSGVTLKRAEYYCIPSVAELDDMVDENGDVMVEDFVVGREEFGMVKFFGKFNVAGFNLDEIVSFRRREIEVYPDTYPDKPPVGEGLNRKSEVTLLKVWPNDKTTRSPIKNVDRLRKVGWLEKLETATERLGATFVDYQSETGTWIFTVDHFTRYGLKEVQIDVENGNTRPSLRSLHEDELKLMEKARLEKEKAAEMIVKMQQEKDAKIRKTLKENNNGVSFLEGEGDSQMSDISQEIFPEFQEPLDHDVNTASPASHHLATAMGVKSHRMQVMKASFFSESKETRQYIDNNHIKQDELTLGNKSVMNGSGFDEISVGERLFYSPVKIKSLTLHSDIFHTDVERSAKERRTEYENERNNNSQWYSLPQPILLPSAIGSPSEMALKAAGLKTQPGIVPLSNSITAGKHNLFADAGLTMGRSFRVGWGPGWTLVYPSRLAGVSSNPKNKFASSEIVKGSPLIATSAKATQSSSFAISCAKVNVSPTIKHNSDVCQNQLIERLKVSLANIVRHEDDYSTYLSPSEGVSALHQYADVAEKSKELLESTNHQESAINFSLVMDLAIALWGNLSALSIESMDTESSLLDGYDEAIARKEALSHWLTKTSKRKINEEIENIKSKDNNHLRIIFSLLTGKQISTACRVAQSNGDSRLSLLMAQASGNIIVRQWLLKQLDDWLEHKVDKFITSDRLKIYALLSGELAWGDIDVCQDLDWKRAFALHLWYQRPCSGLVTDALNAYENSYKGRTSSGIYAVEPCPSYIEKTDNIEKVYGEENEFENPPRDTCYHLIKLYCKPSHRLEKTLAPASYTRYQLDVSLSWHLHQVLQAIGFKHLPEIHSGHLNTCYAAQLEAMGLWHWAIFVLMHIQDPQRRHAAVHNVLVRYCVLAGDADYCDKEAFLLNDLAVPLPWIHFAKVIRSRVENRPQDEAYHLVKSGCFDLAHGVILNRLASLAIINEEYQSIKELLVEIAPRENSSQVNHWNTGGQIYLDYIKIWEAFNDIKNGLLVPSTYKLEKMQIEVSSLCHRINQLPCKTATDRLCQCEMGTMCANFLKIIAKELVMQTDECESYYVQSSVLAPHIEKLPLPEDCCLTELRELTNSYVDELARL